MNNRENEDGINTYDDILSQHVYSLFHEMPGLGHLPIRPVCREGVVYLRGKVDTPQHRALAEAVAGNITGVRSVINQLSFFEDPQN